MSLEDVLPVSISLEPPCKGCRLGLKRGIEFGISHWQPLPEPPGVSSSRAEPAPTMQDFAKEMAEYDGEPSLEIDADQKRPMTGKSIFPWANDPKISN